MASLEDHHKANGARLSRLIIDKGTEGMRKVFDSILPPATLTATLKTYQTFLQKLRCVNRSQMDILFPPNGVPSTSQDFDITLLFILLRNICGLHPPVSTGSWDTNPPAPDKSREANLVRIKYYRNKVYGHNTNTGVNENDYLSYWKDISSALIVLGVSAGDLEHLKTAPLDENLYINQVRDWKEQEERLEVVLEKSIKVTNAQVKAITRNQEETNAKVDNLTEQFNKAFTEKPRKQRIIERLKKRFGIKKSEKKQKNSVMDEAGKCILDTLVKCDFSGNVRKLNKLFHEGTRNWLLEKIRLWLKGEDEFSDSRVLILTASPGVGKTVFSAKVCQLYAEKGLLAACHFCKFNSADYSDPHKMLQSLAGQICDSVKGFREKLMEQLQRDHSRSSVTDAFRVLLKDPLNSLPEQEPMVIVIDALDESESNGKSELLDLIKEEFSAFPAWIKVFITSRPELPVQKMLTHLNAVEIRPDDEDNKADLQSYLEFCLKKNGIKCNAIEKLVDKCEGSFLYANHCQSELKQLRKKGKLPVDGKFEDIIPSGIGYYYEKYFKRLEKELKNLSADVDMIKILKVLVAMEGPLPLRFVAGILMLPTDTGAMKKVICKVNESLSALLLVYDDCLIVFHKTVVDWLLLSGKYNSHEFVVRKEAGHKLLWQVCQEIFMNLEHDNCTNEKKKTAQDYALNKGLLHLKEATFHQQFVSECQVPFLPNSFTVVFAIYFRPDERVAFSGYGWVLLQDDESAYVMTTYQVIRHIKDHRSQPDQSQPEQMPIINFWGKNYMVESFKIELDNDSQCVVATSDEDSVLDYAVLRLKQKGFFKADFENSKHFLALNAGDHVYTPDPDGSFSSKYVGVTINYPDDLVKWLKVRPSSDRSNIGKGIPVLSCCRDIDWDKVEEQKEAFVHFRPVISDKSYVTPNAGLPLLDKDDKVVGMQSFCAWLDLDAQKKEPFVFFNIRLDKIIADITKKNVDLARKLFPRC